MGSRASQPKEITAAKSTDRPPVSQDRALQRNALQGYFSSENIADPNSMLGIKRLKETLNHDQERAASIAAKMSGISVSLESFLLYVIDSEKELQIPQNDGGNEELVHYIEDKSRELIELRAGINERWTLKELISKQKKLQKYVNIFPPRTFVPVGFEHEFAQMVEGAILQGFVHLKLGMSESEMPLSELPFVFETDADDSLELVSPPLLIISKSADNPVPDLEQVELANGIFKKTLIELVESEKNITGLLDGLRDHDINISTPVDFCELKLETWTQRVIREIEKSKSVDIGDVLEILIQKSKKSSKTPIVTQVNFSTSVSIFEELTASSPCQNDDKYGLSIIDRIAEQASQKLSVDTDRNKGLKLFYRELSRVIAEQVSVAWQEEIMEVIKRAVGGDYSSAVRKEIDSRFEILAIRTSRIKDRRKVWLKDNIINLGIGILNRADWVHVASTVADKYFDILDIFNTENKRNEKNSGNDAVSKVDKESSSSARIPNDTHSLVKNVLDIVIRAAQQMQDETNGDKKNTYWGEGEMPEFYGHKPVLLGARQDTYIDGRKVSELASALGWDERLHVVEIRGIDYKPILEEAQTLVGVRTVQ